MMLAGVDGCKGGWIAAIDDRVGPVMVRFVESFARLVDDPTFALIVVDIPIGLPPAGPRECDREARKRLGKRRSSVFPAPIRPMLVAKTWEEACRIRECHDGKRCTKQTYALIAKIREVDKAIAPETQVRVREGHPELSFAMLNHERPMQHPKRRREGRAERLGLLRPHFPNLDASLKLYPGDLASDVIDAFACLWTARRVDTPGALCLPAISAADNRGLRMEIVA